MTENSKRATLINFLADHALSTKEMHDVFDNYITPMLNRVAMVRHSAGFGRLGAEPYVVALFDTHSKELESLVEDGSVILIYRTNYDNPWRMKIYARMELAEGNRASLESFNQWASSIIIEPSLVKQIRSSRANQPKFNNSEGIVQHIIHQYNHARSMMRGISRIESVELLEGDWGKLTLVSRFGNFHAYYMDTWSTELPTLRYVMTMLVTKKAGEAEAMLAAFKEAMAKSGLRKAIEDLNPKGIYSKEDPSILDSVGWVYAK